MSRLPASRSLTHVAVLVRGHTETCINVLVGILTNVNAPAAARIKAAKVLLNYIPLQEVQRLIRVHASRIKAAEILKWGGKQRDFGVPEISAPVFRRGGRFFNGYHVGGAAVRRGLSPASQYRGRGLCERYKRWYMYRSRRIKPDANEAIQDR